MSDTPHVFYQCPDCGKCFEAGTIAHQHSDGEWIFTEDLRRFSQMERWKALIKTEAR